MELLRFIQDHGSQLSILLSALRLGVDIARALRVIWRSSQSQGENAPGGLAAASGSRPVWDSGSLTRCEDGTWLRCRCDLNAAGHLVLERTAVDWSVRAQNSSVGPSSGRPTGTGNTH